MPLESGLIGSHFLWQHCGSNVSLRCLWIRWLSFSFFFLKKLSLSILERSHQLFYLSAKIEHCQIICILYFLQNLDGHLCCLYCIIMLPDLNSCLGILTHDKIENCEVYLEILSWNCHYQGMVPTNYLP